MVQLGKSFDMQGLDNCSKVECNVVQLGKSFDMQGLDNSLHCMPHHGFSHTTVHAAS